MEKKVYNIEVMEGCPYSYEVNGVEFVDLSLEEVRPLLLGLLEREHNRTALRRMYETLFDDGCPDDKFYEETRKKAHSFKDGMNCKETAKSLENAEKVCNFAGKNGWDVDHCRRGGKTGACTRSPDDGRIPYPLGMGVRQEEMDKKSDEELKSAVRAVINENTEEMMNWGQSLFTEMVHSQATIRYVSDTPCNHCGEYTWTYRMSLNL